MIRLRVEASGTDRGWQIVVRDGSNTQLVGPRDIERAREGVHEFPILIAKDPAIVTAPALCRASAAELGSVYRKVMGRSADPSTLASFAAYLFHVLLGENTWQVIEAIRDAEGVELVLDFPYKEWSLHRLPWEMMRQGASHLAVRNPTIAISRAVAIPGGKMPPALVLEPRVLFAVGTNFRDPAIKSAAEVFVLTRELELSDCRLGIQLLENASTGSLTRALADGKPSILHLICHGRLVAGRGILRLVKPDRPHEYEDVAASQLHAAIAAALSPLPILILSACETAISGAIANTKGEGPEAAGPLAAELIALGFPLVIGMTGRITDRACRLFSERFYGALLGGANPAVAAAEGRRAGLTGGADPSRSVDWALPAVFLPNGELPLFERRLPPLDRAQALTRNIVLLDDPPVVCGRLEVFAAFRRTLGRGRKRILVMQVAPSAGVIADSDARFGKTRLIEELAVRAVWDGHLPVVMRFGPNRSVATVRDFCDELADRIRQTYDILFPTFNAMPTLAINELPATEPMDTNKAKDAIRADLNALCKAFKSLAASRPDAQMIVLIDDADKLAPETVAALYSKIFDYNGLGKPSAPVPVVLAYNLDRTRPDRAPVLKELGNLAEATAIVERLDIGAFADLAEWRTAYELWLLHRKRPVVFDYAGLEEEKILYYIDEIFHGLIKGIPSRLATNSGRNPSAGGLEAIIRLLVEDRKALIDAADIVQPPPGGRI